MASLKDVAQLAGVSPSTVSYFLNGKKKVRPETEERILQAVRELQYRPNLVARSLKMKRTKSVGIVVSDLSNIFFLDVLAGIENVLTEAGYSSIVSNSRNSEEIERENLRDLTNRNIDGVILLGTGGDTARPEECAGIPVVSVDRIGDAKTHTISVDNRRGGYIGARYLLQKKKKNIIFIGFAQRISRHERYEGCRDAYAECGIDADKHLRYVETEISPEHGYQAVMDLFAQGKLKDCDAIFASTDFAGFGILKALRDLGIQVPDEIGVMGFDGLPLSQYVSPTLTTVQQPRLEMGRQAAAMLLGIIEKKETEGSVLLRPSLVIRESV